MKGFFVLAGVLKHRWAFVLAVAAMSASWAFADRPAFGWSVPLGAGAAAFPRLTGVSLFILFLAWSGLGIGYAFWVGAALLGALSGLGFEEIVNFLSAGAHGAPHLWVIVILLAGSVSAGILARLSVETRWRLWVRKRFPELARPLSALFAEIPGSLLPRVGGDPHRAGEGAAGSARPPRFGPWLEPAGRLAWPCAPAFLVGCTLFGIPLLSGFLLFLSLLIVVVVGGVWDRLKSDDAESLQDEKEPFAPPSAEALVWALLPLAALGWGLPGLGVAAVAGALLNLLRLQLPWRRAWGVVWDGVSVDLVVLAAGVLAYGEMVRATGLPRAVQTILQENHFDGSLGVAAAFAAALLGAVCGGALTGIGLLSPFVYAMGRRGGPGPEWVVAIVGGALAGELVGRGAASADGRRLSASRLVPVSLLAAVASLLPAFLRGRSAL